MNEEQITQQLQQKIAPAPVDDPLNVPPPEEPAGDPPNQAVVATAYELDELTQFKLHDFFGEEYRANDEIKRQQLQYIYENIADMIGTTDYGYVVAKLRNLEQAIGVAHGPDRLYRTYQWLKLNNIRKNIDLQMGALSNG